MADRIDGRKEIEIGTSPSAICLAEHRVEFRVGPKRYTPVFSASCCGTKIKEGRPRVANGQ